MIVRREGVDNGGITRVFRSMKSKVVGGAVGSVRRVTKHATDQATGATRVGRRQRVAPVG
jgi:hypothetical protein